MADLSHVVTKVAIFDDLDNILVIKRSMDDSWLAGHWELPGGKVDDDEDFVAGAAREVLEETGITIMHKNMHIIYGMTDFGSDGVNRVWQFFTARVATEEVVISEEHSGYQWLPLEEALGIIEHGMTKQVLEHQKLYSLYPEPIV
jgi:8-oxo-dGTP pyrophosphatase MutT (NUDIX family)